MNKKDIIALTILFLISFFIWTLPVHKNKMPFGEGDAAHQFGKMDYFSYYDKAPSNVPFFVYTTWYKHSEAKPDAPLYPPHYFINGALLQKIGGERFVPLYIYLAIMSNFLVVAGIYFLMRKLYSFEHAFLAGFISIFPFRNVMGYIWGQRAIIAGFSFVPVILYCYYMYTKSFIEKKEKNVYLYFLAILLATGSLFHGLTLFIAAFILMAYSVLLFWKYKRIPFNIKTAAFSFILFLVLFIPFGIDMVSGDRGKPEPFKIQKLDSLLKWYKPDEIKLRSNPFLYKFNEIYGGYWLLALILLGILFVLLRRRDSDLLMLSWIIGLYLIFHFDVLGQFTGRIDRLLKAETHLFYPLVVIGLLSIPSFIKLKKNLKQYLKYGLIALFVVLFIFINAKPSYITLRDAYPPLLRITSVQLEFADWLDSNIEEDAVIYLVGTLTFPKERFIHMLSHKAIITGSSAPRHGGLEGLYQEQKSDIGIDYIAFDYSDLALLANNPQFTSLIESITNWEKSFINKTLVYNKNNIMVYKDE